MQTCAIDTINNSISAAKICETNESWIAKRAALGKVRTGRIYLLNQNTDYKKIQTANRNFIAYFSKTVLTKQNIAYAFVPNRKVVSHCADGSEHLTNERARRKVALALEV